MNFKIGVLSDSFRLPPMEGIRKAKELGADGFQVYVVDGPLAPEAMTARDRQEFRRFCRNLGIAPFALCGDLGGHGFERAEENTAKIERSCRIVDLAVDLGCSVVTTHIGVIPEDPSDPRYRTMKEACRRLGAYAAPRGVTFAIETGPEPAAVLRRFLDDLAQPGLGVNLDPANLVMVIGEDPVAAVSSLGPYIIHTHAKDGRQLQPCNPREVYGAFADGGFPPWNSGWENSLSRRRSARERFPGRPISGRWNAPAFPALLRLSARWVRTQSRISGGP